MSSLDQFATAKLRDLDRRALRRRLAATDRGAFPHVARAGRDLVSFACNDYLGLTTHPAVKAAAVAAIARYGAGAGASRLVTGDHPLYADLEAALAAAKGTEAACVFGSGYLANLGVISALAGPDDLIVIDELAHSCLYAGAQLAGARICRFPHNDVAAAEALLATHRASARHALVVTETVFSMDGDRAPLAALAARATAHDAWLLTDDAHGFGLDAPRATADGTPDPVAVPLRMGTLSKALGSYGGYLCASRAVVDFIKTRARSFIYSTGLPPASVAAARAALDVIATTPGLSALPLARARRFTLALGLPDAESPIVPLILGTPEAALSVSEQLMAAGFLVTAIRPPTVPAGTARLRFTFSAAHGAEDVERLVATLKTIPDVARRLACPASS